MMALGKKVSNLKFRSMTVLCFKCLFTEYAPHTVCTSATLPPNVVFIQLFYPLCTSRILLFEGSKLIYSVFYQKSNNQ